MGTHDSVPDARNADVLVWVNGDLVPRDRAVVSVFDSGFTVGDGVWEGLRLHDGGFAFLDRHLDRLFGALRATRIDLPWDRGQATAVLAEVAVANDMHDGAHLRLMVTRGDKTTPSQHPSNLVGGPNVVVTAEFKEADPVAWDEGITLVTSTVRRPPPDTLDQRLNSHSKLHEVMALLQATEAGADEALMLDPTGAVATCNATNFFCVRGGEVWTSTGQYCLPGITRGAVLEVARADGIVAHEAPFTLTDVYAADEAFVTGTFGGLTPVRVVDGRPIGAGVPGPMTTHLRGLYRDALADSAARHPARAPSRA